MPTYVYEALEIEKGCAKCSGSFEIFQPMKEDSLKKCPDCGQPIQRVIQPVGIASGLRKNILSDKNLKEKGFTKLVNEGNGKFRKTI